MLQSNRMKHLKLKSDKFQCQTHWEKGLLPETIMIEFNFRIKANHKNLKNKFVDINGVRKFVNENLSTNAISKISRVVKSDDFKFEYAVYNYDRELESVSRLFYNKHIKNLAFGFYIVLYGKDEQKEMSVVDVKNCINSFANAISTKYLQNKKIRKYFTMSK